MTANDIATQPPGNGVQDYVQVVSFRLTNEDYAIEITTVKEIILVGDVTRVPQMPAYIEGVINLRGSVIPVLDLRKRLGIPANPVDENGRIVVVRMADRVIGLIVDAVNQVMKIPKYKIQVPPDTIACQAGDYLTGIAKLEDRMVMLLAIQDVLSETEHSALAETSLP